MTGARPATERTSSAPSGQPKRLHGAPEIELRSVVRRSGRGRWSPGHRRTASRSRAGWRVYSRLSAHRAGDGCRAGSWVHQLRRELGNTLSLLDQWTHDPFIGGRGVDDAVGAGRRAFRRGGRQFVGSLARDGPASCRGETLPRQGAGRRASAETWVRIEGAAFALGGTRSISVRMSLVLNRQFPAPADWQAFERLCFDLFKRLWRDQNTQFNGRSGQPQAGVDVYGESREDGRLNGVQCKGRDGGYGASLTVAELRSEVEKAKTFVPSLDVFILATTAPNDVRILAEARELKKAHRAAGLFDVEVYAWDTLKQHATDYPDILQKHFPDLAPLDLTAAIGDLDDKISSGMDSIRADILPIGIDTSRLLSRFDRLEASINRNKDAVEDQLHLRIRQLWSLVEDGNAKAARVALERLKTENWPTASARNRYRLLGNIAAADLALHEVDAAVVGFKAAHAQDPMHPGARAILATAHLLEGESASAYALAMAVLTEDPTSEQAVMVSIESAPEELPVDELLAKIPENFRTDADVLVGLSIRCRAMGDADRARALAEQALAREPGNWRAQSALAEVLLEPIFADPDAVVLKRVTASAAKADFQRAISLLRSAWSHIRSHDTARRAVHLCANFANALYLAGLSEESGRVVDEGLAIAPHYAPLLRRAALRAVMGGDWASALNYIASIGESDRELDDEILIFDGLLRSGDAEGAHAKAVALYGTLEDARKRGAVAAVRVEAASALGEGRAELEAMLRSQPTAILLRLVGLDVAALEKDEELKRRLLDEIGALQPTLVDVRDRVHAAEAYFKARDYSRAADAFAGLHPLDRDTPILRHRLQALLAADRRREARELYESVADAVRELPDYLAIGASIFERIGSLPEARRLYEKQFKRDDTDLSKRLRWLSILERLGDPRAAERYLASVPPNVAGSPRELIGLAQAIDRHLGTPKALHVGYRALRAGFGDPQVHLGYAVGLFFLGCGARTKIVAPETVGSDTAVVLTSASAPKLVRIIETENSPALERDEIAPGNTLANRLLGMRVGDEIEFGGLGPEVPTYRIEQILDKFLFAHFRTLERFGALFPDNKAFGTFSIDETKGPDGLEPLLEQVRRRAESLTKLEEFYRTGGVPLPMIAEVAGANPVEVWDSFRAQRDMPLLTATGVAEEYANGEAILESRGSCVVDPLTLHALVSLGISEPVFAAFDSVGVTQTAVDFLRRIVVERTTDRGTRRGRLGWDGERYRMYELTDEDIERRIANADHVLDVALTRCRLVPAEAPGRLSDPRGREIVERWHPAFVDTVYAAQGTGAPMLADDQAYRSLVRETFGVDAVWSQAALLRARRVGSITSDAYADAVDALVDAGYAFTMIGWQNIIHQLDRTGWRVDDRTDRYLELLALPNNDPASLRNVLGGLFTHAIGMAPGEQALQDLVWAVFDAFLRSGSDRIEAVARTTVLATRDALIPIVAPFKPLLLKSTGIVPLSAIQKGRQESAEGVAREIAGMIAGWSKARGLERLA